MIGKTIAHYQITEKLDSGGMGIVYKAQDTHLNRTAALKFLPPDLTRDTEARERFTREAQAASALDHANICTIYEIGEADDGQLFIAMAYYEGQTLKYKIKQGPLPVDEAVDLAIQIAQGLARAHEQGIIHRDIKPANVMVTDRGEVKILDFGLAKLVGSVELTTTGTRLGTVAYMSPEQARSEAVDHRTDIWSLGIVLYEMLTDERPFKGDYETALVYSILNEEPQPLSSVRNDISAEMENIVKKAFAKDAKERYQTVDELLDDLRLVKPGITQKQTGEKTATGWIPKKKAFISGLVTLIVLALLAVFSFFSEKDPVTKSIAVLPLENLSGDPEQEFFSDGMTDALISDLGTVSALRVISRTSVMAYKQVQKPLPEIADDLNVTHIVEGSVLRANNRVRISTRLMDAAHDQQLWSKTYERDLENVLVLQREVARDIVREIQARLSPREETRLSSALPVNPEAHEAYLKGHFYWNKRTEEALLRSVDYYKQALEHDPDYALAYAGLSEAYFFLHIYGTMSPSKAFPQAIAAAEKALVLDEQLAEAHTAYAQLLSSYHYDWEGSEKAYRRAIALNPGHARTHHLFAIVLSEKGEFDEAIAAIQRAKELDPLSLIINANAGFPVYAFARRYQKAFEALHGTLELNSDYWVAHHWLGVLYSVTGVSEKSIEHLERAVELSSNVSLTIGMLAYAYARAGNSNRAQELLSQLQARSGDEYVSSYELTLIHVALGDVDRAFTLLEDAFQQKDGWLRFMNSDPRMDPLRADSRFNKMLTKIGIDVE